MKIKRLKLYQTRATYVSGSDSSGVSVGERLPKKIVWSSEGKEFVIESSYEIKKNRAYVLSAGRK